MIENSEIVTKLIITLLAVYLSIKFIAPIMQLLWEQIFHHHQKPNIDIDVLVERQKQILRSGLGKKESSSVKKQSQPNKTLTAYQEFFQKSISKTNKDQESIDDGKKILSLFDNLQWGEGPPFEHIRKKIQEEFNTSIDQFEITAVLKKFFENDFLLSRKGTNLSTYQEIIEILELAVIVHKIFSESIANKDDILKHLGNLWKISPSDIKKGFCLLLQKKTDLQTEIQKDILNDKLQLDDNHRNNLFQVLKSDDNKFFQSKKIFLKNLKSNAEFFSILSPLEPPKDKHDLKNARKIFHADENTSLEDIKKTYKELAGRKHPDKLSSHGIPAEFETIATKNFSIIQQSYDIILKNYENNDTN